MLSVLRDISMVVGVLMALGVAITVVAVAEELWNLQKFSRQASQARAGRHNLKNRAEVVLADIRPKRTLCRWISGLLNTCRKQLYSQKKNTCWKNEDGVLAIRDIVRGR